MLRMLRYLGGKLVRRRLSQVADEYLSRCEQCYRTQRETLSRILALNATSEFSRQHGLNASLSPDDYRLQIPVSDFELVRPYVEQVQRGVTSALLGANNPLLMFALSSGTTAESKSIPITKPFLDDYRRGWNIWGLRFFNDHEKANRLDIVQLTSDYEQFHTSGGTPCGNISGLVTSMQSRIVRSMYTIPPEVAKVRDTEAKSYISLRCAMANEHVGLITTANPSTLIRWAQLANEHKETLIRDIHDGTIHYAQSIPGEFRTVFTRGHFRPNRSRAKWLENLVQQTGQLTPGDFWPHLQALAVWTGGAVKHYLPSMRKLYGNVPVRDHGLSASEGRMTIPLEDETSSGVLDIGTHYFEFIPEAEYGRSNPVVLGAHELELGQDYYILLTTTSGLYRYDIRDVVRCTGFYHQTPMLEFLHKGAHISNLTGEKLAESQVVNAVHHASRELHCEVGCFTVAPVWGAPPHYRLHTERLAEGVSAARLAKAIDCQLINSNCEYRDKRESQRLAPLEVITVPQGTWQAFRHDRLQRKGGSLEQYKHPCLVPDLDFSEKIATLSGLSKASVAAPHFLSVDHAARIHTHHGVEHS